MLQHHARLPAPAAPPVHLHLAPVRTQRGCDSFAAAGRCASCSSASPACRSYRIPSTADHGCFLAECSTAPRAPCTSGHCRPQASSLCSHPAFPRATYGPLQDVLQKAKRAIDSEQVCWDAQRGNSARKAIVQNGVHSMYTATGARISRQVKEDIVNHAAWSGIVQRYSGFQGLAENLDDPDADTWVRHYLRSMIRNMGQRGKLRLQVCAQTCSSCAVLCCK